MTKRDLVPASTRHHHARFLKYYPRRHCAPSLIKSRFFPHTTNLLTYSTYFLTFWNSLYVYTRGILGCLLGFWPLGQNPAGAIKEELCYGFVNHHTSGSLKNPWLVSMLKAASSRRLVGCVAMREKTRDDVSNSVFFAGRFSSSTTPNWKPLTPCLFENWKCTSKKCLGQFWPYAISGAFAIASYPRPVLPRCLYNTYALFVFSSNCDWNRLQLDKKLGTVILCDLFVN